MSIHEDIRERPKGTQGIWRGYICGNINTIDDPVYVIVPEFSSVLKWGPCRWQSRDATSLPEHGDACLVVRDNLDDHWVLAWWPSVFESPEL